MAAGRARRRRSNRLFVAFERFVLGIGMTIVAFFIERRLIKAIREGGFKPKPQRPLEEVPQEAQLAAAPKQVGDQPDGQ